MVLLVIWQTKVFHRFTICLSEIHKNLMTQIYSVRDTQLVDLLTVQQRVHIM